MSGFGVAAIGLGWWGGVLADAVTRSSGLGLVTCFARTEGVRATFAERFACETSPSLEAVLADDRVDGLIVATPHQTHLEIVERAAAAGKHVFIEKPLALTVADADACRRAAEEAGIVLSVGHHRRRSTANRLLRAMIDRDELGIIHHAQATFHVPKYQEPAPGWRSDPAESPAGGMTGLGVHMVDTLQYLLGPIARVTARSKRILARSPLDDMTTVLLEFARGPLGTLDTSLVLPRTCDVVVVGHKRIAASRQDGSRLFVQSVADPAPSEVPIERTDELVEQLEEFARCAGDGSRPETDAATAVGVVAVFEAVVASAASGDTVEVRAPEALHG